MARYVSKFPGKKVDELLSYVETQKELSTESIMESTPEQPVDLNTLTTTEGKFTIYYFEGASSSSESGKPIELEVYKDNNGDVVQRYTQNGVTMERTMDAESQEWSTWKPVSNIIQVEGDQQVSVTQDTIVFRTVTDASDATLATT